MLAINCLNTKTKISEEKWKLRYKSPYNPIFWKTVLQATKNIIMKQF